LTAGSKNAVKLQAEEDVGKARAPSSASGSLSIRPRRCWRRLSSAQVSCSGHRRRWRTTKTSTTSPARSACGCGTTSAIASPASPKLRYARAFRSERSYGPPTRQRARAPAGLLRDCPGLSRFAIDACPSLRSTARARWSAAPAAPV